MVATNTGEKSADVRAISRRQFLAGSVSLLLSRGLVPSLDDDLRSLLPQHPEDRIAPERGEILPSDMSLRFGPLQPTVPFVSERGLFLTFDDGPLDCTGHILDLLAATGHKATFFVIGRNLKTPHLRRFAVRAVREGHDIGNHSYSHPDFSTISAGRAAKEIRAAHELIREVVQEAGGDPIRQNLFFRFPYGVEGNWGNYTAVRQALNKLQYGVAWWDLDTKDWRMELQWSPRSASRVVGCFNKARPHDVVLLHDRQKTAKHLPRMLEKLRCLQLVSVPLSDLEFGPRTPPCPNMVDRILKPLKNSGKHEAHESSTDPLDELFGRRNSFIRFRSSLSPRRVTSGSIVW